MSIEELIGRLAKLGVELWFEGDRLHFRAPKGVLGAEERAMLSARRAEVIASMRRSATAMPDRLLALSYSQQSLWFLHEQVPGTAAYHVALSARIHGAIDAGSLRQAVQGVVDRHEMLRTTYEFASGAPRQRIASHAWAALNVVSAAGFGEPELKAAVLRDYREPFDLEHGPVLRATLFTRDPGEHVLLVVVHHIAADGWSLLMLFEELLKLYGEAAGGPPASLPRPSVTYSDYTAWQDQMLASPEGERLWEYWRSKLAPPRAVLDLPTDRPRRPRQGFNGSSLPFQLDSELTHRLRELARAQSTTPFVVLLATFQAFLHRVTRSEDVIVGTPTFGRSKPEFMGVVGDFVNSVPLRGALTPSMPFRELVRQLRSTLHEALDAQELPFPLLVRRLHPVRDPGRAPIFDAFFVLQRFEQFRQLESLLVGDGAESPIEAGGLRLGAYSLDQQEGQFDLAMHIVERGGVLHAVLKYSTDLFDAGTIRRFAEDYLRLAEAVAADPDALLGALPGERRESAVALIDRLAAMDIRFLHEGGRLRVNAPKGAVSDELKAVIAARRDDIVAALRAPPSMVPLQRISRDGRLPLSAAQQRLWFLDRLEPGRTQYNIGLTVRFEGRIDTALLQRTVEQLAVRHELLSSRIGERDGEPLLEILPEAALALEVVDLSTHSCSADEARNLCAQRLNAPYDLARGPLATCLLVRSGPDVCTLAMGMHHVIGDGWSLMLLTRELCALYDAFVHSGVAALAPLTVQYVDYAAWEREQLRSGRLSHQLTYWKQQLAGAPALLELPTDRPRPAAQSFRGHMVRRDLDTRLLDAIKQLARQHDATLFMTLLAAWQVILARHSGQDDIVVGSPMANRDRVELEGIVGCFVNNIVLRTRIEGNPTFAELLVHVKSTTLGAFDHRDVPFDVLVEALRPERSTSHAPIFQTLFTLHSFPREFTAPRGLSAEILGRDTGTARFDLSLETVETDGGLAAMYEFASDLFDERTILRLHVHLEQLLAAVVADAGVRVHDVPLLAGDDEAELIERWNDSSLEHDRQRCLHQLLEASARATPDAVAIVDGGGALTYRALDERANRLSHLLVSRGVTPGAMVAVCVDRTANMPVAIAAVLKAGAAYVPLDPTHPGERLRSILEDAGVACAITLDRFTTLFDSERVPLIVLDACAAELEALPVGPPVVSVVPTDRAYVIYTSGSTGRPKGVEVEHRNVVSFLEAMRHEPGCTARDTLLAVTTLSFDIAGLEIWLPLSVGARVVIASRADTLDGGRLMALLEEHGVTVMQATPATWRLLLGAGWAGSSALRCLCGGEALPRDLAADLVPRVAELWNMYGPTETTIWSTLCRIKDPREVFIGRPIANTRAYVIDRSGQPTPIGVAGELCIGGEGVARGYHNRPELTGERFVTVMLAGGRVERVYRTGDMARFRGDGQLEYLGRRDQQVKVRGYRIELGEIESALASHPGVGQCVVSTREDSPGDQRLVGYVVPMLGAPFDAEAARDTLRRLLPEYMVPNQFVELEALPLTPNGKIDRAALPAPRPVARPAGNDQNEILMTPEQRGVAAIWREVLRVERVGLHDNFFELGGHSLLLARLHAALCRELDADMGLVELFQYTTIAAQAERLAEANRSDAGLHRARLRAARQMSYG